MVTGSCFAEQTGIRFRESGFRVTVNPFGVLYNPSSISEAIRRLIRNEPFSQVELVQLNGLYHSFSHHGSFSDTDASVTLGRINDAFRKASDALKETTCLILTFGTAWVYILPENGQVVANCHKFPASRFQRYRLTMPDIVDDYTALINYLLVQHPDLKILLTVSPIRHLKDGFHENTLSKSILLMATEALCNQFSSVVYYPSYELLMDDLRDYRFYADDMMHPSPMAQDYIWEHFSETFFGKTTREIARQVQQIRIAMEHKPFHPEGEAYKRFAQKNIASIELLSLREPGLDLQKEKAFFERILRG